MPGHIPETWDESRHRAETEALLATLRFAAWVSQNTCPACARWLKEGHAKDCVMVNAVVRAEGRESSS